MPATGARRAPVRSAGRTSRAGCGRPTRRCSTCWTTTSRRCRPRTASGLGTAVLPPRHQLPQRDAVDDHRVVELPHQRVDRRVDGVDGRRRRADRRGRGLLAPRSSPVSSGSGRSPMPRAAPEACSSGDAAGLDYTGPVITPVVTGTMGSNGWYVSDVSVQLERHRPGIGDHVQGGVRSHQRRDGLRRAHVHLLGDLRRSRRSDHCVDVAEAGRARGPTIVCAARGLRTRPVPRERLRDGERCDVRTARPRRSSGWWTRSALGSFTTPVVASRPRRQPHHQELRVQGRRGHLPRTGRRPWSARRATT